MDQLLRGELSAGSGVGVGVLLMLCDWSPFLGTAQVLEQRLHIQQKRRLSALGLPLTGSGTVELQGSKFYGKSPPPGEGLAA